MQPMNNALKNLPIRVSEADEQDVMSDIRYIRKSCSLITDALQKGCDVLQMPNGNVVITEIRTVSFQYEWNDTKGRFEKAKSGSRLKKLRRQQSETTVTAAPVRDTAPAKKLKEPVKTAARIKEPA